MMRIHVLSRVLAPTAALALILLLAMPAWPCTTFLMEHDGEPLVGKSYDWDVADGLVITNRRGVQKKAFIMTTGDTPAEWISTYASVTFNQYGRELPNGGMNEAGLVVEIMWLNESEYPQQDDRPVLSELQWIQWALDSFADVSDLAAAAPQVRISPIYANVHFLACSKDGACAAFEYVDGDLVITTGDAMVAKTLTNHPYGESVAFLEQHTGFGGTQEIPQGSGSLERFVRASALAVASSSAAVPDVAFGILDSVAQSGYSQWNIVYQPAQDRIFFRTANATSIKTLDVAILFDDCRAPVQILDIDYATAGEASQAFTPYSHVENRDLIERSTAPIADSLPLGATTVLAMYPDGLTCTLDGDEAPEDVAPADLQVADAKKSGCSFYARHAANTHPLGLWGAVFIIGFALITRRLHTSRP